jgi:hemoglobin/transferrin/lactoferrin receptor protein
MGLADWGRPVPADGLAQTRHAGKRLAALMAGVAMTALSAGVVQAQQADQPATAQQDASTGREAKADDSGATLLDKILLLSRIGETAIQSLASASHIDREQLDRRMASTLNDVFFGVPGVNVQADARRVSSAINMRGLQDYGRVAVIVDGARQDFQRSGHGTESTFYLDPDLVKSVDVIRGPVANTYGSGAIGGVVYFDTKDANDFLKPEETWATSLTGRYESNGSGWTTSATGAYRFTPDFDVLGNIVYRDYGEYKDGDGNRVNGGAFDVLSGMLKTTMQPTDNSELKLGWVGTNDGWSEMSGGAPNYDVDLRQNTLTGQYHVTDDDQSWLDLHVNTSFNGANLDQTKISTGALTSYDLDTSGVDLWNTSRFETGVLGHELTYGGDWLRDHVTTTTPTGGSDLFTPSGTRQIWGAYVQDKVSYDWLEVIGGLRYDSFNLEGNGTNNSGDRLSPRLSVGVSPFDSDALKGLQFYGTYAEGYRAPTTSEALISGIHPFPPFPFLPNPDLKPETAKTWEFGVNYQHDGVFAADDSLRLKAAYFNNDVQDYISFVPVSTGAMCGPPWGCYQNQNFASARINGFEFESIYDAAWGYAGLSAAITRGYTIDNAGVREDLLSVPSSQITAQLGLRFLEDRLTVGGEVQYNGKPKGNDLADDYTLVNAFATYQANDNFKLDFRVDNLFDARYATALNAAYTNPVIYDPGITLKVAATMRFGG